MDRGYVDKELNDVIINEIKYNYDGADYYIGEKKAEAQKEIKSADINFDYKAIKGANINIHLPFYLTPDEIARRIMNELKSW